MWGGLTGIGPLEGRTTPNMKRARELAESGRRGGLKVVLGSIAGVDVGIRTMAAKKLSHYAAPCRTSCPKVSQTDRPGLCPKATLPMGAWWTERPSLLGKGRRETHLSYRLLCPENGNGLVPVPGGSTYKNDGFEAKPPACD